MKIMLPSFIQDEIEMESVDFDIQRINDLKDVLKEEDKLFDFILESDHSFKKNVRFVKNDALLFSEEYDEPLKDSDEIMLLIQFVGG